MVFRFQCLVFNEEMTKRDIILTQNRVIVFHPFIECVFEVLYYLMVCVCIFDNLEAHFLDGTLYLNVREKSCVQSAFRRIRWSYFKSANIRSPIPHSCCVLICKCVSTFFLMDPVSFSLCNTNWNFTAGVVLSAMRVE